MKKLQVEIEGHVRDIWVENVNGETWVHLDGETFSEKLESAKGTRRTSKGAARADSGDLRAPMPGKITQIRVKSGDTVQAGDILIVMEAMKMEYTLKSPRQGQIAEISCQLGAQVTADQLLVSVRTPV